MPKINDFLVHYSNTYDESKSEFYLFNEIENSLQQISATELSEFKSPIATCNIHSLITSLRKSNTPLPSIIVEIEQALKINSQVSKDQGGEKHWDIWLALKSVYSNNNEWNEIRNFLISKSPPPNQSRKQFLFDTLAKNLSRLWSEVYLNLQQNKEIARFESIEIPVQQILWKREFEGLAINELELRKSLEYCQQNKYSSFYRLSSITKTNILGYKLLDFVELINDYEKKDVIPSTNDLYIEDIFEVRQDSSNLVKDALTYCNSKKNYSILRNIVPENNRIYPHYENMGTVTSRILVSNPRLQELKKIYRGLISPDQGYNLVYLDYSQFEPGILASLSKDENLIHAYNNSDLYIELADKILGDEYKRDVAKKIFLAYCYGMSSEGITKIFPMKNSISEENKVEKVLNFFASYPSLESFRSECINSLNTSGTISSLFGNYRKKTSVDNLSHKETRWAMNQKIQGTASLILKEAIININSISGYKNILLPMHDAILLQYKPNEEGTFVNDSILQMKIAFKKWCPQIEPKIKTSAFYENNTV